MIIDFKIPDGWKVVGAMGSGIMTSSGEKTVFGDVVLRKVREKPKVPDILPGDAVTVRHSPEEIRYVHKVSDDFKIWYWIGNKVDWFHKVHVRHVYRNGIQIYPPLEEPKPMPVPALSMGDWVMRHGELPRIANYNNYEFLQANADEIRFADGRPNWKREG